MTEPQSDGQGPLLSLIVHELRSPLAVVGGYLRLLLKSPSTELGEAERRMIEEANHSCARLLDLVRDLANLAALETTDAFRSAGQVRVFSLWEEVLQLAQTAEAAPIFSCGAADLPAAVRGDAGQLKQAFTALVAATRRERGDGPLESYGFVTREDGAPQVVIALGGPGIALRRDEVLQRAPFDRWRGGSGMSLPIAWRIIQDHGGQVWSLPSDVRGASALSLPIATE